jgi:hypothetical protein
VARHDAVEHEGVLPYEFLGRRARAEDGHGPIARIGPSSQRNEIAAGVECVDSCFVSGKMDRCCLATID